MLPRLVTCGPSVSTTISVKEGWHQETWIGISEVVGFLIFQVQGGLFPFPSLHLFNMSGTSLPQILKGDFRTGFLHEGVTVWKYTAVLGNLCRAYKKTDLPFSLSWPTMFQLSLPSFLHLHSSCCCRMFYTASQKGRIVPAKLCCEGEVRSRQEGFEHSLVTVYYNFPFAYTTVERKSFPIFTS